MRTRALVIALVVCVLGAAIAGIGKVIELRSRTAAPSPTAFVQAAWGVYRFAPGHRIHVEDKKLDCMSCHEPRKDGAFDRPAPTKCVACHAERSHIRHALVNVDDEGRRVRANLAASAGEQGARAVTDCVGCHGFGPDPDKQANDCLSCHEHTRGNVPPIVTHAEMACKNCHDVHENQIKPLNCTECHAIDAQHGHESLTPQQTCLTCHRAHDRAESAGQGCMGCHGEATPRTAVAPLDVSLAGGPERFDPPKIPATATFAGGHAECASCHAPHSFTKQTAVACASCHTKVHVLEGKGHAECTSCHAPHAVRQAVAQNVCVNCHGDVALEHTKKLDARVACTSCHDAHPVSAEQRTAHAAQTACASCHADIGQGGNRAHQSGMACATCHQPHGFALPHDQTACASCHAQELTLTKGNPGHSSCAGCHQNLPHGADLDPKSCASCHTQIHASKGHSACTNCHEPHKGAQNGRTCAECHAPQAKNSIHADKEVRCVQCHDQHTTELAPGVSQCVSCHDRAKLPGRHDVAKHAENCATCHAPHSAVLPGARETCLQCHQDRKDHEPEAARCEGCHQFVRAARAPGGTP